MVREGNLNFPVRLGEGHKTGFYLDQRENRLLLRDMGLKGEVLDVFCHTGGFGIMAAMGGAQNVTFLDSSSSALEMVDKNATLNGVSQKCNIIEGEAFEMLEKLPHLGRKYDVVAVDPPAFIKSKKDLNAGMRGYQKLAMKSAPLVERSGFLFFASCSYHAETRHLIEVVSGGLAKTGRPFQLIKVSGAGPDHPVHPMLQETGYLKALTFRFLD